MPLVNLSFNNNPNILINEWQIEQNILETSKHLFDNLINNQDINVNNPDLDPLIIENPSVKVLQQDYRPFMHTPTWTHARTCIHVQAHAGGHA